MEKQILNDVSKILANRNSKVHYVKVAPDSDEHLKVWLKEPTFLQLEQAQMKLFNINMDERDLSFDMKEVYQFLWDAFVEKTEPALGALDMMRLNPYVGAQIKALLPDPFSLGQVNEDLKGE